MKRRQRVAREVHRRPPPPCTPADRDSPIYLGLGSAGGRTDTYVLWISATRLAPLRARVESYRPTGFRVRLAAAFKKDLPAALVEDAIAIAGAWLIVQTLS